MGLTQERIRQVRQLLGAPKPSHPHRPRKCAEALQWAKDNLEKLIGMSAAQLRREHGLTLGWRSGPLFDFLKPFLRDGRIIRKHRWDLMNFRLPNRDLRRIWRLPYNMPQGYRQRRRRPPPTWHVKPGKGGIQFSGPADRQAYQRAVKAEERKAARCFAQASGCGAGGKVA